MNNANDNPRAWRGVLALQCLTLLAVVVGRPATPEAAAQYRPQRATLPNAAEQRDDMIELLGKIEASLDRDARRAEAADAATNERLDRLAEAVASIDARLARGVDVRPVAAE